MARSVRSLTLSALMTALTAVLSPLCLPVGPVSLTLQTFAAALTGYMLSPGEAFFSVCAYLLLGACGMPVFSGFAGGMGVLTGSTGGYLAGLPLMAALCAVGKRGRRMRFPAGLAGLLVVYAAGTAWLSHTAGVGFRKAVLTGAAPFLWKDVLSVVAADRLGQTILRRMRAS